jgi:putative PIN family toxin of toxin-antitoxin system
VSDSGHRLRVVLDTNVLVSGLAYPGSVLRKILNVCLYGGMKLVLSRYILDETSRVLARLKQFEINRDEILDLLDNLVLMADLVEPEHITEPALRDPNDHLVLGTLIASSATYLISGDKDLLALTGKYPIVTPAEFWERHG